MKESLVALMLTGLLWSLSAPALSTQSCYRADADSGEIRFIGEADGSRFNGRFDQFQVRLCLTDIDLATASIEVRLAMASANTRNRDRDQTLHGDEFFDVDQFPEAVWTSTTIRPDDDASAMSFVADGQLGIRGIEASQPVALKLETGDQPRLVGTAQIMRLDWQVGTGEFEDVDFIRNRVDLEFELNLVPDEQTD